MIDTETGESLEAGQEGELLMRGPSIMKGYLNKSEATKDTIDGEGWLHSGE